MRCRSCDQALTDAEATKKHPVTREYEDLCDPCGGIVAADLAEDTLPNPTLDLDDPHFEPIEEEVTQER